MKGDSQDGLRKREKKIWLESQLGKPAKPLEFAGKSAPARFGLNGSVFGIRRCGRHGFTD